MRTLLLAGAVAIACGIGGEAQSQERFDLLVRGGTLADGTSAEPRLADVGVVDGRIARVGSLGEAKAERVIEAAGLVVAPGFIDVHTHADDLADLPEAANFVRMGLTTIVAGNCGSSTVKVADALAANPPPGRRDQLRDPGGPGKRAGGGDGKRAARAHRLGASPHGDPG